MKFRLLLLSFCPLFLSAQSLQDFEKRVTEFTLANGLHFIIFERHQAPVVSFHSYVNAGSVDDPAAKPASRTCLSTWLSKEPRTIGTKNWPAEKTGAG